MDPRDAMDPEQIEALNRAFGEQPCSPAWTNVREGALWSRFQS